jgi:DNA gyrase subunit B
MDKILQNNEIISIIKALGVGIQEINEVNGNEKENGENGDNEESKESEESEESEKDFDLTKLRYHKTIIMCDADIDGKHIETLLLTFFFRHLRALIDGGFLYLAVPPLYKVSYKNSKNYVYSDSERDTFMNEIISKYDLKDSSSIKIQRYKGLGEMNPDELFDTTMNRETRLLKKVTYEDYIENDLIFTKLMGKEVLARKKYIFSNFDEVKVLDI